MKSGSDREMREKIVIQLRKLLCILLAVFASAPVLAFGPEGHALVAFMAQANLRPSVAAEVNKLLALEGATGLDQVASWADDWRSSHGETAPFHFVDIPLGLASYTPGRDCHRDSEGRYSREATCIVAKLPDFARILGDPSRPARERLVALKYVVHLVADLHQPMHAADNHDRGGNQVRLAYFGRDTNLHAMWDGHILEREFGWTARPDFSFDRGVVGDTARKLDAEITSGQRTSWRLQYAALDSEVIAWAEESHALASAAYVSLPSGNPPNWQLAYQGSAWPVLRLQLQKASVRLASVLNLVLDGADGCPSMAGFPAFYVGPFKGPENTLAAADVAQDLHCAAVFKNSKYPGGFIGVYGGTRIGAEDPVYLGIEKFAERWTREHGATFPIMTGAGPGVMRAASLGAFHAGGPSIGYTTYYDKDHDYRKAFQEEGGRWIITDGLIFTSVAARESAMLAHSAAIIVAPGGSGTGWEIFQALDTLRNGQLATVPMFLVGNDSHWNAFCAFVNDMSARGTLPRESFDRFVRRVENPEDVYAALSHAFKLIDGPVQGVSQCPVAGP